MSAINFLQIKFKVEAVLKPNLIVMTYFQKFQLATQKKYGIYNLGNLLVSSNFKKKIRIFVTRN